MIETLKNFVFPRHSTEENENVKHRKHSAWMNNRVACTTNDATNEIETAWCFPESSDDTYLPQSVNHLQKLHRCACAELLEERGINDGQGRWKFLMHRGKSENWMKNISIRWKENRIKIKFFRWRSAKSLRFEWQSLHLQISHQFLVLFAGTKGKDWKIVHYTVGVDFHAIDFSNKLSIFCGEELREKLSANFRRKKSQTRIKPIRNRFWIIPKRGVSRIQVEKRTFKRGKLSRKVLEEKILLEACNKSSDKRLNRKNRFAEVTSRFLSNCILIFSLIHAKSSLAIS